MDQLENWMHCMTTTILVRKLYMGLAPDKQSQPVLLHPPDERLRLRAHEATLQQCAEELVVIADHLIILPVPELPLDFFKDGLGSSC